MFTSPERSFNPEIAPDETVKKEQPELKIVENAAPEKREISQELWRATIEADIIASERTQEIFKQMLEAARKKAGQTATRTPQAVERFGELSRAIADNAAHIEDFRHLARLYDSTEWDTAITSAKDRITDEAWLQAEAEAREYATRRAEAEKLVWEDAESEAREYATRRAEAEKNEVEKLKNAA